MRQVPKEPCATNSKRRATISSIFGRVAGLSVSRSRVSGRGRVSDRVFLVFNRELAALLKAGLPVVQSLDILLERGKEGRFRNMLREIRDRVQNGDDLSDAFARFGPAFPPLYASSLKAGERSGEIEQVIRRFVRYLQLLLDSRRRVISAVVYPLVLMALSVAMVGVMSLYVIPQFESFFGAMDVELPALTKTILAASLFLRRYWAVLLASVVAVTYVILQWSRTRSGRLLFHRAVLQVPVVGTILHRFALSQFTRSLATLLAGGIPLVPSIEVAMRAVSNAWVGERMSELPRRVSEGGTFHEALEQSGIFTDVSIDMVKVGESTGALDEMLEEVSEFLDQEAETQLERMLVLIEPLMLVVMGIVIAVLLMAMYLPMFSAWEQN